MNYSEIPEQDRIFICSQIPVNDIKRFLQDHPSETSKIYKGRVKTLTHEKMVYLLTANEKKPFIANFVGSYLEIQLNAVQSDCTDLVEAEHMDQQEALVHALSRSIFASRIPLYLMLTDETYNEKYSALLQTCVAILDESKGETLEPCSESEDHEREEHQQQIAQMEEKQRDLQLQFEERMRSLSSQRDQIQQELSLRIAEVQSVNEKLNASECEIAELKNQLYAYQNPKMPPLRYEHRSLCKVEDTGERIWLIRLADYSGDTLTACDIDPDRPKLFDNRDRLFQKDGPDEIGYIGVWDWKTVPSYSDPAKDYVESAYCPEVSPIEVIIFRGKDEIESLISDLQTGVTVEPSVEKILFSIYKGSGNYVGVLCPTSNLVLSAGKVKLSERTYSLPQYEFKSQNMISIGERRYYRKNSLGPASKMIPITDPLDIVKQTILDRMTRQAARKQGIIKNDWRKIRSFIQSLETEDFYRSIMETCGCSLAEAHSYTSDLLQRAESYIQAEDIDSTFLGDIAMNHAGLKKKCMELLTEEWEEAYGEEIRGAREKEAAIRGEIATLAQEKEMITAECAQMKNELTKADTLILEKKTLADEVEKKVAERIAVAQKNAADFICEMAFHTPYFMPKQAEPETKRPKKTAIIRGTEWNEDDIEGLSTWKDVLNAVCDALEEAGIAIQYRYAFGAYLYSCYLNHFPVLLAGPFGREIADAFSLVLTGRRADYVDCTSNSYRRVNSEINELNKSVLVVDHPFVNEWVGHIPEFSVKSNCFTIFVHPYKEDLVMEPSGILNYMIPLLTDLVIDQVPQRNFFGCHLEEGFQEYSGQKAVEYHRKLLQRFQVTPIVYSKVCRVLTDMHAMCEDRNADNDGILCLAPLAYIMDKTNLLVKKLKENDTRTLPMSTEVSSYLLRMLGGQE